MEHHTNMQTCNDPYPRFSERPTSNALVVVIVNQMYKKKKKKKNEGFINIQTTYMSHSHTVGSIVKE